MVSVFRRPMARSGSDAHGRSNSEIAARLYLSDATIKTHIGHILAKLGLRDRVQVVVLDYDIRLVQPKPRR
jgi:DNA-binding NarL/FixJ family response regulator